MNNIKLIIEGQELELDNSVKFAITKQFENISNPTNIINDWCKTVQIPFSVKNNKIFGDIYNVDRMIASGSGQESIGIYFDPYKKLDFRLEWNDSVVMSGYAKLDTITKAADKGTYNVTLNGQLGKIFQEMQKITFAPNKQEEEYIIDTSIYVDEYINKDIVKACWDNPNQRNDELVAKYEYIVGPDGKMSKKRNLSWNLTDFVGFAPNNSFDDDFQYDSFQLNINESKKFEDALGDAFYNKTGVEAGTAINDGLLPRDIGEFRSYKQIPYMYFNKLFQIFQKKAESVTGYTFNLDNDWFSNDNPYWKKLIITLNKLSDKNGQSYVNSYKNSLVDVYWGVPLGSEEYVDYTVVKTIGPTIEREGTTEQKQVYDFDTNKFNITMYEGISYNLPINATLRMSDGNWESNFFFNASNALQITTTITGKNGIVKTIKTILLSNDSTISTSGFDRVIRVSRTPDKHENGYFHWAFNYNEFISLDYYTYGDSAQVEMTARWANNTPVAKHIVTDYRAYTKIFFTDVQLDSAVTHKIKKSGAYFNLADLWNNDYNIFDFILNYCKIFRLLITVDDVAKKINFIQAADYFTNYSIEDWTDKLDLSKNYDITPVYFDHKFVLFNYNDSETYLYKKYKEKYGINYGEYKLTTNYNFNQETNELFDNISGSMINTDNCLSWNNLYQKKQIIYGLPEEYFINCKDTDKNYVEQFGQYYFINGSRAFSTDETLNLRDVYISDDTDMQNATNTYFYSQDQNATKAINYPDIRTSYVSNNVKNLCLFNVPKESYTYDNDQFTDGKSIYYNFWESFINERYNIQNKKLTCYLKISPRDYINFEFRKFVLINNQLYIVNKIFDYDITSPESTKVELITVQNIEGYTKNNFNK